MIGFLLKLLGDPNEKKVKSIMGVIDHINALEPQFEQLTDEELRAKTDEFKAILAKRPTSKDFKTDRKLEKEALDKILPEAFATVREAGKRVLNMRHFDVQLIGGYFLHNGHIAEMRTGEGKTLVATLPAYLNALTGKGVHVITVNDYLAKRDSEWMGKIYKFLGLPLGLFFREVVPQKILRLKKQLMTAILLTEQTMNSGLIIFVTIWREVLKCLFNDLIIMPSLTKLTVF